MPSEPAFPHLPLIRRAQGRARLEGGGGPNPQVEANKTNRKGHSAFLQDKLHQVVGRSKQRMAERAQETLPTIQGGIPFVLQVPEEDDGALEFIAEVLGLEIVAEYDDGYLIVSASDIDLSAVLRTAIEFGEGTRGAGTMAKIISIDDDPLSETRLRRVLGDELYARWPLHDDDVYILDISVESAVFGAPSRPRITSRTRSDVREAKEAAHEAALEEHRQRWERTRIGRETEISEFAAHYEGIILSITDESHVVDFPDSFAVRIRMCGRGFKDLIANYASLFEVTIPDEVQEPLGPVDETGEVQPPFELVSPDRRSPFVCIVDSGIQEAHRWLRNAIHTEASRCFLPGADPANVADLVDCGGHGTRVAGAVLYPLTVPRSGCFVPPTWLQNARVLDDQNRIPESVFPPDLLREVAEHFRRGYGTRIFNHSISANRPCRTGRMSAWATTIDLLAYADDVLFIQAAGNIPRSGPVNHPGIADHLTAGRAYPQYLLGDSSRIANPAQSLQALTVGSVAGETYCDADRRSVAEPMCASAFTRSGFGLWQSIKPEVVEFGGDEVVDSGWPPSLTTPSAVCPELVRSTLHGGPAIGRDSIGTSYAAPKVTHIVAAVAAAFPEGSTQLYRALVVNSARWPNWVEGAPPDARVATVRTIGYGMPALDRATENSANRVTLIADEAYSVVAGEGLVFGVPIPEVLRTPGEEFDVRVDVTLAYVAEPRRTRRSRRGYLGVWLDWKSSRRGETFGDFLDRALKGDADPNSIPGPSMPWMLGNRRERDGLTEGVSRIGGTLQKDWAVVRNHELPDVLGIVVRGHKGWNRLNPNARAKFSLVVSLEALGVEAPVYAQISQAVEADIAGEVMIQVGSTAIA